MFIIYIYLYNIYITYISLYNYSTFIYTYIQIHLILANFESTCKQKEKAILSLRNDYC